MIEIIPDDAHFRLKVITHHNEGWSIRRLCRHYGISRNRVRRILRSAQARRTEPSPELFCVNQRQKKPSKLDEFLPPLKDLLDKYPKITGVRMLEELRPYGYQGGLTILRGQLKQLRPQPRTDSVIRFETDPGVQGQMDWSPYLDLLGHHPRHSRGACRKEESPRHRICASLRYGVEPVKEAFERIGDAAEEYLAGLINKHPRGAGLHARMILQLKERYGADDINRALSRALRYYAFDAASIERILKATATPRSLESQRNGKAHAALAQTIPPIKQRNLDEYSSMLAKGDLHEEQSGPDQSNQEPLQNAQASDRGEKPR